MKTPKRQESSAFEMRESDQQPASQGSATGSGLLNLEWVRLRDEIRQEIQGLVRRIDGLLDEATAHEACGVPGAELLQNLRQRTLDLARNLEREPEEGAEGEVPPITLRTQWDAIATRAGPVQAEELQAGRQGGRRATGDSRSPRRPTDDGVQGGIRPPRFGPKR